MLITEDIKNKFNNKLVQVTLKSGSEIFGIIIFDNYDCFDLKSGNHTFGYSIESIINIKRLIIDHDF